MLLIGLACCLSLRPDDHLSGGKRVGSERCKWFFFLCYR